MRNAGSLLICLAALGAPAGCDDNNDNPRPTPDAGTGGQQPANVACAADNGGITLPSGFCATVFADEVGKARHITVTPTGRVFVDIAPTTATANDGHVLALYDADNDGAAEQKQTFGTVGGNGIAWGGEKLYVAANDRVVRYDMPDGNIAPLAAAEPALLASNWPANGDHGAKAIAITDNSIFMNIGSPSNACQVANRQLHSPGKDPCDELVTRAGIWQLDPATLNQVQTTSRQVATGMRNTNALAVNPANGELWGGINGRDQLHENWPELFTEQQDMDLPADEVVKIVPELDRGWPYCYYDAAAKQMKLAPEYGGDGVKTGRCAKIPPPEIALAAHAAVLGMTFASGTQFPAAYRTGLFMAEHGSRFDVNGTGELHGWAVEFMPFENGQPTGQLQKFATGFDAGKRPLPDAAPHRPVGLAMMPDGSLLIGDDKGGRIWRVYYTATTP